MHLIATRLPVNAVQERLGHSRLGIVSIHYPKLLEESTVAAAITVSSKLSARSAQRENAGFKPFGSQTAASFFAGKEKPGLEICPLVNDGQWK